MNTAPVGVQLAALIYDGLGRLIRTIRQDPNAAVEARLLQRKAGSDLDAPTTTTASAGFRRS